MHTRDTPLLTLPRQDAPKPRTARWELDDVVVVNGRRWMIRSLNRDTGRVYLTAANTTNHGMGWSTTLDRLPEKQA